MWIVKIEAEFDNETDARLAMSDMEEVVGKKNGEILDSEVTREDA